MGRTIKRLFFLFSLLPLLLHASAPKGAKADRCQWVNLFMGTSGDNGQVSPGATVPFGMVCLSPDSDPRTHVGYDYAVARTSGISVNRISGVGCSGGGGNLRIRPVAFRHELQIDKSTEQAVPGYYQTSFTNGIQVELTATNAVAVERYRFPEQQPALLAVDFASTFAGVATCEFTWVSDTRIEGFVQSKNVCSNGLYTLYFVLVANQPFGLEEQTKSTAHLCFASDVRAVEVRIALSPLSTQAAGHEYDRWVSTDFASIQAQAKQQWQERLSGIEVKGATDEEKILFYTSLYRTYLSPANVTSADGTFLGTDGKQYKADGFLYYSSWSLWDTFRTKFPLLVLTEPDRMRDIAISLLHLYKTGKKEWSTPFESTPTVRTEHAVVLLLDAYRKGITNLDFRLGYEGIKQEMDRLPLGSPDQRMESAYDLWAMSQIAGIVGQKADSLHYGHRADTLFASTWKQEFMTITPSFAVMRNNGLYQGTRWQYRWAAPQYIDRMIDWVGKDSLRAQLSYFFDHHLYNQGNEPDIHVPFLFNRLGAPQQTQQIVRQLLTQPMIHVYGGNAEFPEPYFGKAFKNSPEGYCPEMDEDDGTMSAWYIFGAMGIYPLLVGDEWYELTSPLFDQITLKIAGGRTLTIRTRGRKDPNAPIRRILFNKQRVDDFRIAHSRLMQGGTLLFDY